MWLVINFMEQISFQYPTWYFIFCVLAGIVYALGLYFRDRSMGENAPRMNTLLGILRFLGVAILSALLLSPILKTRKTEHKKPIVIFAQDVSESIGANTDSLALKEYSQQIEALKSTLGEQYDFVPYSFGANTREGINFPFSDKTSNLANLFSDLYDLYSNQNLGAIIFASDGIYNEGSNPVYASNKLPVPIYSIAMGDTTPVKDVVLKRVFHNKIAYLGDKFTIQVDIAAQNFAGETTALNIYKVNGKKTSRLDQSPIEIKGNQFFTTKELILDADQAGVQHFRLSLRSLKGEKITANNTQDIFVDVLDARQKILILAHAPHPDIAALKKGISQNKNYQVNTAYANDVSKINIAEYDLVILHQLPDFNHNLDNVFAALRKRKTPVLYILGGQSNVPFLNKEQGILKVKADISSINEVQGVVSKDFGLFKISEELRKNLPNFSPLLAPFGDFKAIGNGKVLLQQRIGKITTKYPLLVFGEHEGQKMGVLAGEGLWKWQLFDFLENNNHDVFNELIEKTIQYLSVKDDKRKFRVSVAKNIFKENEAVVLDAELYNNSYELVNDPEVSITITDSEGRNYDYTFSRNEKTYSLNAGILPIGNYTFKASTNLNGEQLNYNGKFGIQPIQLELFETTANHTILQQLSSQSGGRFLYPNQLNSLPDLLAASGKVKPVIYENYKTRPIIQLKGIFFLVLSLLSIEWFFRRYFGAY